MDKELVFITVVPSALSFAWEVEVQLNNYRKFGYSNKTQILVFLHNQEDLYYWDKLILKYLEVEFHFFENKDLKNLEKVYIPIIRPYCLQEHFKNYPDLTNKVIYYSDSDVIFTKSLDFSKYLNDDVIYASNISSYTDPTYFDSKIKDVLPFRKKEYEKIDVLDSITKSVGLNRKDLGITGGCQYILKNIDSQFWTNVLNDCITIKTYLNSINNQYFPNETKGFQSWCADLWAVWWNIIKLGYKTECPDELNFSWATSPIEKWNENAIYHNAGVSSNIQELNGEKVTLFNKSDFRFRANILTPFDITDWGSISYRYCNYMYLQEILSISNPVTKAKNIYKY